jgi:LAGLIDADG endonuclease
VSGADNQQERLSVEAIPESLGSFLSGFALGEASFHARMSASCRLQQEWRISAAFNVSQHDRAPLELLRETLGCGTFRKAGNDGWYWEVNSLPDIEQRVVPFFERFPLVGSKASDFDRFKEAVRLLAKPIMSDPEYIRVLSLREGMNRGGKRRHTMERILRDYTPSSPLSGGEMR